MSQNLRLYPWYQALRQLSFWQAVWFLYFEQVLTAQEAIALAALYEIVTVVLEVPSGYFSDVIGRRTTLIVSALANAAGCLLFFAGNGFAAFVTAQVLLGVHMAFNSGTDSALLYDSLRADGKADDIAAAEAKAYRFSYLALAVSAAVGGLIASDWLGGSYALTYLLSAAAAVGSLAITFAFKEPPRTDKPETSNVRLLHHFSVVLGRLRDPVLLWMAMFFAGLYVLSHVPFVFIQPYLRELLATLDLVRQTPVIIGFVVAAMMTLSAILAWFVVPIRGHIGTKAMFMIALILQTLIIAAMAWIIHPVVIALLLVRMVPGTLTRPFLLEAIQPRLESGYRATYLSLQSLAARLLFSATLFIAAWVVTPSNALDQAGLTAVLPWFALGGAVLAACLWRTWPRDALGGE